MATSVTLKPNAIDISGSTSGTTTLQASAVAGTTTLTLPAATDTLVGKATTDTLTNKTLTGAAMNGTLGATTPSTASVTTLTTSSTVTHSGGTANGVAYLDGSKVLTTGSALVFDGSNLGLGVTPSAWNTTTAVTALQLPNGSLMTYSNAYGFSNLYLSANAYLNSSGNWIYTKTNSASLYQQTDRQHAWLYANSGTAGNAITFTQAMTLDASGNLGIGTTSPTTLLTLVGSDAAGKDYLAIRNDYANNAGKYAGMIFQGRDSAGTAHGVKDGGAIRVFGDDADWGGTNMRFYSRTADVLTERARIDSSGNLLVGKTALNLAVGTSIDANTSTGSGVRVVSSATTASADGFQMYSTGTSTYRFAVGFNGTISAVSTVISSISDARLKENVRDLNVGLSEIMALKPRLYDWKEGKGADIKNARGFIAQEFEIVFPDLIDESRDPAPEGEGPYKAVRADLIPVLVKAIQEQQALITQLQADVASLKGASA